ncbi:hypothetical protein fugu_001212 [Takifugu bimaculatus]|uniref:Polycystic kidney disease 1b n=1 Tax=Takifugu bimaculatus TaxID=433685 RepID=A0A4Z2CIV5_9TELE|nr:hypothetical protein fugu_001212 [Takifugu bimaculatus]
MPEDAHQHPTGDYTLHVRVSDQHDNKDAFVNMRARLPLNHLLISASPPIPLVKQSLFLDVSTYPTSYDVNYTWDFGDGSGILQDAQQRVSHAFQFAGFYNITVYANNMLTVLTTWHMVEVSEKISGLAVSNSGPTELNSATHFTGTVTTGASLTWTFDFGDGTLKENFTESSASYLYKSAGVYTVKVTVWNSVSQAHQSITTEVYQLAVSGILPTECVPNGRDAQLTALVNGNISTLTFHWLFGDGSSVAVVNGRSVVAHTFQTPGAFHINLTVFSNATFASFNSTLCVEATIDNITMLSSQEVVAVGAEVCFQVLVFPKQVAGYQLQWLTSPSSLISRAANTQQQCFIFRDEGIEGISVIASNNISVQTAKCRITIQKPVEKFSVAHDIQGDTIEMNTAAWFWVVHCVGSNVSVLWDFGDGSSIEQTKNVSHVFTVTGHFTVTATAFNAVSRESLTFDITVLLPVSDLSIHINQPYSVVGDETVFTAVSSAVSNTTYFWVIDGVASPIIGTYKLGFTFSHPGVYQVRVIAKSLLSREEAAISVEALERIEGLRIESLTIVSMKYVPTHENLLFVASVSKGSNVTYQWFATKSKTHQESTGDGDFFQMSAETPDRISVHVMASNILGEASSGISLEAVDRVKGALITSQSNVVALGEVVNMSVSVAAGSDLKYVWQVKPNNPPVETDVSFLLHTFTSLGHYSVNVSVQNALSQSNASKNFTVQEEVQEVAFEIDGGTHPFYIPTRRAATLHCLNQNGSNLHWSWKIKGATTAYFDKETSIYSFPHAGIYQVSLNVSNRVNWQAVSHNVTVQDPIKELILKVSKSSFCSGEEVTFVAVISSGSNASFVITFRNGDWIHSQTIPGGRFTTSSLPAGTHLIRIKAWNQVSSAEMSSSILILDSIQGLRIVNCCAAALEAEKRISFKSEIKSSDPVNYTWMFHLEGFEPIRVGGQEVFFTPPGRGSLLIHVSATDGVCSKSINDTVTVQRPVQNISLVCHSDRIFVGHAAIFSVDVFGGENVSFLWDFGDSTDPLATDLDKVSYTYRTPGKYSIMVRALDNISHTSAQLCVEVEILQCSSPQVALSPQLVHHHQVKQTLSVGQYCLQFTVLVQGTPLLVRQNATITVVNSPLVAVIKGGSKRLWPSLTDLTLDGSDSRDLDQEPGDEDALTYDWTFATLSPQSQLIKQNIESKRSRVTVPSRQLQPGTVYTFTLTVHKIGRTSTSVNQTVIVCEGPVTPVTVRCVSCSVPSSSYQLVSHTLPVVFLGHCEQCDGQVEYMWSAEDQAGLALDLQDFVSPAENTSPSLELRPGVLQSGQSYTFTFNVSLPDRGRWGSASIVLQTNTLPRGGLCVLSPETDILLLETVVTYDCSGWQQNESRFSQLIYTFQVEACHPNGTTCPLLTLYKGTRSSFGSLLPIGRLGQERSMSVVTAMLLIEDHLGTRNANCEESSERGRCQPVAHREKPDRATHLGPAWQPSGDHPVCHCPDQPPQPDDLSPVTVNCGLKASGSLNSEYYQIGVHNRASILQQENDFKDLTLPLLCVAKAVPSELSCGDCQKRLLETVGKVIHVIEEQASHGMSSAVKTGSDILNIIGNTLAAASKSGPGSYSSSSSTPESASSVTLSALDLAGTLMRSVMHLHGIEQAPVSLSTPYISAVGFHGDPAHLLCTQNSYLKSSKAYFPCHFYIPSSFTAHLKSQRSEVVQVLLGIDSELTSNPLVTAADPPISTTLIAMELSTPQGKPIAVQHLDLKQAIRVTLSNKHPIKHGCTGSTERKEGEADDTACLAVSLPTEGSLNFTIEAVNRLVENAGLYVSFNFSLDTEYADPKVSTFGLGHIKIEVSSAVPGFNASQDCLVRELTLSLTNPSKSAVESIFLSPLWNGTRRPLSVNLTSALVNSGPIHVSVCVFSSLCQYYSQIEGRWRSEGLQPLEGSTLREAHCLTQHLTVFGASLFVHPGAIVLLPPDQISQSKNTDKDCDMCVGLDPSWYIQHVVVWDLQSDHMFFFLLEDWLSVENHKNSTVEKDVLASCPDELSEFRRVFTSQLVFGVFEHHLWVSLWEHPGSSCFTRGQRVMCSALVLHLYFALSVLWYGAVGIKWQGGPVSARVPVNVEMVAVGMIIAVLVFPLQSFLCFLFRKIQSQVTVDTSVSASPACHSVEMDVHIGHSDLSGSSFLSLPDSCEPVRESHSSLLESKLFNSSILDFWAASGLAPKTDRACLEEDKHTWPSYDSLLNTPPGEEFTNATPEPKNSKDSSVLGQICKLKRKKVLNQLRLAPPLSNVSTMRTTLKKVNDRNLTTTFTLSEENLMMSIAADNTNSSSDSGRDSPRTPSSLSNTWCTSCSSWPEQGELQPLWVADTHTTLGPHSGPSLYESEGLYRCASLVSVDSMASTFLPSISPGSTRSPSTTRIGIARGQPNWLLPSWALRVIYPAVGVLLAACLTVVVLYGSLWPRNVVLLWLISTFSAFLTSALLLEPLKVEDQLALETTVVRTSGAHGRRVQPPYGYGLLRAKQEASKVQTLRSLMKNCVCQLLFLLLLLMVNYQDSIEQCQARLLHSAIRRSLHTAPSGMQNLTELMDWSEVKQWIIQTLVPHLHQNPSLGLVGRPRLQYTQIHSSLESVFQGDAVVTRQLTLTELSMSDWSMMLFSLTGDSFINFHHAACLAQRCSQSAAILLTLLILKLLRTLRFMRRWTLLGQVLQISWRKLWALTALLMSLSMVCVHLGIMLFSHSVEGFSTLHQASISLLSLLRNHMTLQKLCRVHPILGPLFGLLMFGSVWFLAKLCGAVLISTYRAEKVKLYHPSTEPQDYEMLEFFIKRLKLWLGLKKAKEFRHSVKFEGMDIPPSRLSQESHFSTSSSSFLSSCSSPCTPSSALSVRSEDQSMSESGLNVLPFLDRLLPCVSALLLRFDQVNQVTEDVHSLEMKLEEALAKRRKKLRNNDNITEKTGDSLKAKLLGGEESENQKIRQRKIGVIHPKTGISLPSSLSFSFTPSTLYCPTPMNLLSHKCNTFSEPDSIPFQRQASSSNLASEEPRLASGTFDLCPAGSLALPRSPRRRAWHSGSSNSADAPQRSFLSQDGLIAVRKESCPLTSMEPWQEGEERRHTSGVPVKRKAWT